MRSSRRTRVAALAALASVLTVVLVLGSQSSAAPAPDTTIDSGPSGLTTSTEASFSFSSNDPLATFECQLDGGGWAPCTSPVSYFALSQGLHAFEVRAVDPLLKEDPTPAQRDWTVDTIPPDTTIDSGPSATTTSNSATFAFSSSEGGSTFECQLDGGNWESCNSPQTYNNLSDGSHTFRVRSTDQAGNTDGSEATRSWSIDTAAPDTSLDSGPPSLTNSTSASFSFSSSESGSTFQCMLDGGGWQTCASPAGYTGLSESSHTFQVRAVDPLGNADPTPASQSWTIDTTPPDTTITSGPPPLTTSRNASFSFSSSESGLSFECKLDDAGWESCSSPKGYSSLSDGSHTFRVRATDSAGNTDQSEDSRTWTVDASEPDTTIDSGPPSLTNSTSASFAFSSSKPGSSFECNLDNGTWESCGSPKAYSSLGDGSHTFRVRAIDVLGNTDSTPASQAWTVDTTPPNTTINSGPAGVTSSQSASFSFSSSESGSSFECMLDSGGWASCSSPKTYNSLSDGVHTFRVRATDQTGNVDPSEATQSWTVLTTTPDTSIDSGPSGLIGNNTPTFTFSSSEPGSSFECKLDGPGASAGSYSSCGSPKSYTLADGSYAFSVRASNAVGNTDPSPATRSFTIDTTAPNTLINSGPQGLTNLTSASFDFSSTEPGSTFECQLQPEVPDFQSCTSPAIYLNLSDGSHTFRVRAIDQLGHVDATPASRSFTVDTTPPDTTIDSGPSGTTADETPTFTFSASGGGASFECRVDSDPFAGCSSPYTTAPLTNGPHSFQVRAKDAAGNVDPSPASRSFTVNTVGPNTFIDSGPTGATTLTSPSFAFHSDEVGATFECELTGPGRTPGFTGCTSPQGYGPLSDGAYTFSVRAIGAGGSDQTPATRSFTVDTTSPNTTITSGPSGTVNSNLASFTFTSNEPGSSFQCRLDGAAFAPCASPATYGSLAEGSHSFRVRAIDQAGNSDLTEASRTWTVDTVLPDTVITSGPSAFTNSKTPTFAFSSEAGASFQCKLDGPGATVGVYAPCTSPKSYSLNDGSYTFSVRAIDVAGSIDPTPATRPFTVDTLAPTATITSGPTGTIASASATFSFSSELNATFECKLDADDYVPCASPATYSLLPDGPHTFKVRATDQALNTSAPVSRTWTVETTVPDTFITSGPLGPTNSNSPSFAFSSNELQTTFTCRLDGPGVTVGTPAACTSPKTFTALADGSYTFFVQATDAASNQDPTPAARSFTVDTVAPTPTIDVGPTGTTASPSASFQFSSNDPSSTFECKLDAGDYAPCTSPADYLQLTDGSHTFKVRATDPALNTSTAVSRTWTVKTGAPDTSITSGPSGATNNRTPTFVFSSNEPQTTFTCRLDGPGGAVGTSDPCTSPKTFAPLADGSYTLFVQATDVANNLDATPAKRSFTVDTVAPDTAIKSSPPDTSASTSATFDFSSSEPGSSFQCRLDGGNWAGCASSKVYADLAQGRHGFEVRAIDPAGNVDSTPAGRAWTIATPAPPIAASSGPQLISPFPVVRIAGTITKRGVKLRLLSVSTPKGSKVTVKCRGARCPFARRSKMAALRVAKRLARAARVLRIRRLEKRFYPVGVKIEVFVTKFGMIGKYTRFKIRRGKPPARIDRCLVPGVRKPVRCPRS